jgi:plastocyanin
MTLSSFALRRGALITLTLVVGSALAACGGDSDASEPADGGTGGTATVENGAVEISAADLAFDVATIEAPAGEEFTITLTNNESQPHNVSVYREEGGEEIVIGDVITGPDATVDTVVPALEPGTYYFVCDVHPEMNGTLVVSG